MNSHLVNQTSAESPSVTLKHFLWGMILITSQKEIHGRESKQKSRLWHLYSGVMLWFHNNICNSWTTDRWLIWFLKNIFIGGKNFLQKLQCWQRNFWMWLACRKNYSVLDHCLRAKTCWGSTASREITGETRKIVHCNHTNCSSLSMTA